MQVIRKGVDVSSIQKNIDWAKVKDAGYDFAMIRVAWRGYGKSGSLNEDACYKKNIEGAAANGLKIGAYVYSQALNDEEVIEEANLVLKLLAPYRKFITMPICFDFEGYNNKKHRVYKKSTKEQRTNFCQLFNNMMHNAGYSTMIYGSQGNIKKTYDLDVLKDPIWCAKYPYKTRPVDDEKYFPDLKNPEYNSRIAIWQYSSYGSVPGIPVRVDVNDQVIELGSSPLESIEPSNPFDEPKGVVRFNSLTQYIPRESVKWMQWELLQAGFVLGKVDGKFGSMTLSALKSFQKSKGLVIDGICGPATIQALKND